MLFYTCERGSTKNTALNAGKNSLSSGGKSVPCETPRRIRYELGTVALGLHPVLVRE